MDPFERYKLQFLMQKIGFGHMSNLGQNLFVFLPAPIEGNPQRTELNARLNALEDEYLAKIEALIAELTGIKALTKVKINVIWKAANEAGMAVIKAGGTDAEAQQAFLEAGAKAAGMELAPEASQEQGPGKKCETCDMKPLCPIHSSGMHVVQILDGCARDMVDGTKPHILN